MLHSLVRAPGKRQQWAKKYKQALHKRGSKEASFWNVSTEQQLKAGRLKYMGVSRGWGPLPALAGGSPVGCRMEDWVCTAQGDVCGFALWRKDGIGRCGGCWALPWRLHTGEHKLCAQHGLENGTLGRGCSVPGCSEAASWPCTALLGITGQVCVRVWW